MSIVSLTGRFTFKCPISVMIIILLLRQHHPTETINKMSELLITFLMDFWLHRVQIFPTTIIFTNKFMRLRNKVRILFITSENQFSVNPNPHLITT